MKMLMTVPLPGGCTVMNMPVRIEAVQGKASLISFKEYGLKHYAILCEGWVDDSFRIVHDHLLDRTIREELEAQLPLLNAKAQIPRVDLREAVTGAAI